MQGLELAAELGSGVPPSPLQPASKPAAPRLHKTVASTRRCQGRSAGKGLARGGEDGCFPGLVIFPAAGGPGRPRWGVDPDPRRSGATPQRRGGGGEWGSGSQPGSLLVFLLHLRVLCSPTSSPVVGEVRRGRGGEEGPAPSRVSRPAGLGLRHRTAWRAAGPRPAGGGGAAVRASARPQFPLLHPF